MALDNNGPDMAVLARDPSWPAYVDHGAIAVADEPWGPRVLFGRGVPDAIVDYEVGGETGSTSVLPYTERVVTDIEDFELRGATLRIRRPPEGIYGPVGGTDYASQLAFAVAQNVDSGVTEEQIRASFVGAL